MALAYFHPSKVSKKNRGVLKMGKAKLHEYMSLKKNAKKDNTYSTRGTGWNFPE